MLVMSTGASSFEGSISLAPGEMPGSALSGQSRAPRAGRCDIVQPDESGLGRDKGFRPARTRGGSPLGSGGLGRRHGHCHDVRLMRAALSLLLVLVAACPAAAQDTWTDPFPGVRHLHRRTSNQNANVVVVDLCAAGVSARGTASGERRQSPSSFGSSVGAQIAVNGDFFSYTDYSTNGPTAHGGAVWGGADHDYVAPLAFGAGRADLIPHEDTSGAQAWMQEVVSGHPTIVHGGSFRASTDPLCTARHPRTFAGLSADRRTLILGVVDGRATGRIGMTCAELANILIELGAAEGVNLDGGGSSAMWMQGAGIVNYPSDGSPRVVANHLAIYARGSGPAAHCPHDYAAAYVEQTFPLARDPFELYPGQEQSGYIELRNTGHAPWTPGTTMLGTTEPRDVASPIAGSDWVSPNRAATIDRVVPPGETGRFTFSVRAPEAPGDYPQFFNLVEEGVTWFSEQGGPPDAQLQVRLTVVPSPPCADGVGEAWQCEGSDRVRCEYGEVVRETCAHGCAGGACEGEAMTGPDAGTASPTDGGRGAGVATGDAGAESRSLHGGCRVGHSGEPPWALSILALLVLRRRRRGQAAM